MFGMLSVLAELQRELIVANTRDGLAAARARGRHGGRRPVLDTPQIATAQRLYDEGRHTVQQIADILKVNRSTLYGHLDKTTVGGRPRASGSRLPRWRAERRDEQRAGRAAPADPGPDHPPRSTPVTSRSGASRPAGPPTRLHDRSKLPDLREPTRRRPRALAATAGPGRHLALPRPR